MNPTPSRDHQAALHPLWARYRNDAVFRYRVDKLAVALHEWRDGGGPSEELAILLVAAIEQELGAIYGVRND